ncbi:MAG: HDIG domain-containing metalloprotein [bacterium]
MERQEVLKMVESQVCNDRLRKHMLAVEAVMRALARRLGADEEKWALVGLLHDIDYDVTCDDPENHGRKGAEYLRSLGFDEEITRAVESHAGHTDRTSPMEKALFATDPLTGLIVAAALMHPSKSIRQVTPEFVMKRFKEKRFAAGADRDQIRSCEEVGLTLSEFIEIGLKAMQEISEQLGL